MPQCTWSVLVFKVLYYKFKPKVRMQFKNAITIVHTMVGMCGMHKLYCAVFEIVLQILDVHWKYNKRYFQCVHGL